MTTLRWRLTALYGTLFFAAGVAMLTIVYVVLSRRIPRVPRIPVGGVAVRREVRQLLLAELTNQRDRALHELLIGSLIALAIVTVVAGVLGWAGARHHGDGPTAVHAQPGRADQPGWSAG